MTDSPSLRKWFEDRFDLDDYEPYLFDEKDLSDILPEIHGGRDGKNVEAITEDNDFISPYERDLKRKIIDEIDIDRLRKTFRTNRKLWNEIRADIRGMGGSRIIGALTDDEILNDYKKKIIQKKGSSYFLTTKELVNEIRERGLVEPFV